MISLKSHAAQNTIIVINQTPGTLVKPHFKKKYLESEHSNDIFIVLLRITFKGELLVNMLIQTSYFSGCWGLPPMSNSEHGFGTYFYD